MNLYEPLAIVACPCGTSFDLAWYTACPRCLTPPPGGDATLKLCTCGRHVRLGAIGQDARCSCGVVWRLVARGTVGRVAPVSLRKGGR